MVDYFWEYEYKFGEFLKKIFPNTYKRKFSMTGNGIYNLIIIQDKIYEVKFSQTTKLIEDNLSTIEESKLNIKTRNLKNYNFLGEEDLKSKINSLKELGVSINSNIEVLNSDINIIKRIKLCNSLGISIYDENNKIKKDILNKDLFFVPDSKIDEYVNERTLVLN